VSAELTSTIAMIVTPAHQECLLSSFVEELRVTRSVLHRKQGSFAIDPVSHTASHKRAIWI
jgi:hypothetical protein